MILLQSACRFDLILEEKGYEVVGEAGDGVKPDAHSRSPSTAVILDIGSAQDRWIDRYPVASKSFDARVKIIVLTGQESRAYRFALHANRRRAVSKHQRTLRLNQCFWNGEAWLITRPITPALSFVAMMILIQEGTSAVTDGSRANGLATTGTGASNKTIARHVLSSKACQHL